ncbi:MAG TPA: SRPBCC family protein [Ktedonobacteraceae bacterium]|nr:SRPBCC family protein [Ktedonobacteraceae bacterium]
MSTPFHSPTTGSPADGTIETQGNSHILRFERYLPHSIEQVWAAITEPRQLVAWLAEADVELSKGGHVQLRWLNTDEHGNQAVMNATITQLDPPRLLEYAGDIHGVLRWELREEASGCILTFSSTLPASINRLPETLAGWHTHLDFLTEALDGQAVDWSHWPLDRWTRHYERYSQKQSY